MTARILIIAGSDSGGGAGIQADIKTVTMLGGHAMTAITAITAQNTIGVQAVQNVEPLLVAEQIASVVEDIGVDAIKIGMVPSSECAAMIGGMLLSVRPLLKQRHPARAGYPVPVVVDPVLVATSGDRLVPDGVVETLRGRVFPFATVVTPNLPELDALGGEAAMTGMTLVKGGHAAGTQIVDRLIGPEGELARWESERINTTSTHGTGCTLATAIAAGLGQGMELIPAIERARRFVRMALREAPRLGGGHGPMGHQNVRLDVAPDMRLNQFILPLTDYEQTRDFYARLGLTLIVDSAGNAYARFETAGGATLSLHGDEAAVNFECEDLDATIAKARAVGIEFEGPVDQPWLWREAWTFDPSGNRVLLYQAGENRRYPPWRI